MSTAVVTVEESSATVNVLGSYSATVTATTGGNFSPEISYAVQGGTDGTQPTFNGNPLFDASYVLIDQLVYFRINVLMTNITNFGTGQYYMTLPFPTKHTMLTSDGHVHDTSTTRDYTMQGHAFAGSDVLKLFYTSSNGQQDEFEHNKPFVLATADIFHIAGFYIRDDA
jgi:hypothetical protein